MSVAQSHKLLGEQGRQRGETGTTAVLSAYIHDDFEKLEPLQLVHLEQGLHSSHRNQVEDGQQGKQGPGQHRCAQVLAAGQARVAPQHILQHNSGSQAVLLSALAPNCHKSIHQTYV